MNDFTQEILRNGLSVFFALLQMAVIAVVSAGFKLYWDVRRLRHDMDAAFKKLRELESDLR